LKRLYVIDALRCVLALWVAIGHAGAFPLFGPVGQHDGMLDLPARGVRTLVWGPPAVIVFFLISGFCIHYPFVKKTQKFPAARFYARRYLRILVPVIFTVAVFKILVPKTVVFGSNSILWYSTLWSVLCEEIYYAVYPLLNQLQSAVGWPNILKGAFSVAIPVALYYLPAQDWQDLGIINTAIVLLPVWLLGCYLAENLPSLAKEYSIRGIWIWRLCAWSTMWLAEILHFHGGIHQIQTGLWTGVIFYFWLRAEISYYRNRTPWSLLVWAGRWSYSLYLVHPIVISVCAAYGLLAFESRRNWIVVLTLILLASYAFYLVIERPSHHLAKKISLFRPSAGNMAAAPVPSRSITQSGDRIT
jgi:peptidoglycan/LPS O-acetylase OafA/YrhL